MTPLKRSFFWAAFYLAIIFVLGQTDYTGRPIINFSSYFYLAVLVAVPVTLFFPTVAHFSVLVPMLAWAGIYMVLVQMIPRSSSAVSGELSVLVLEFVLLEAGVWFAHQLAQQIGHAESLMDALALSAFPNRAHDMDAESDRIQNELTRSRRYGRPLSLIVVESRVEQRQIHQEILANIQYDLLHRFKAARIAQIIDDCIRQTDLMLRDHRGRFLILCMETTITDAIQLGSRISQTVKSETNDDVLVGTAAFPDDALTFEELFMKARNRSAQSYATLDERIAAS